MASQPAGNVLTKLFERLLLHSTLPGGQLDGVKVETVLAQDVEAQQDLPSVRLVEVSGNEDAKPDRSELALVVTFSASVETGSGLFGLLELIQRTLNAMERDGLTNVKDLTLGGTLVKPMNGVSWEVAKNTQSLTAFINVTFNPRFWARASRL